MNDYAYQLAISSVGLPVVVIARLVERLPRKQKVVGSNPASNALFSFSYLFIITYADMSMKLCGLKSPP